MSEKLKHLSKLNFEDSADQDLEQRLKEREQVIEDLQRKIVEQEKQQNLLRNEVRPPSATGFTSSPRRTGLQTVDGCSPPATAPSPSLAKTRSQTSASRSPTATITSPSLARTRSHTSASSSPSATAPSPSFARTRFQTSGNRSLIEEFSPEGQLSSPNATTPTEEPLKSQKQLKTLVARKLQEV